MDSTSKDFPARLVYQPVLGFVEQVASKSPAPGGGSVAALAGALGAALLVMVTNLTIGKKNYAAVTARMTELRTQLETLRAQLTDNVDADTAAFNRMRVAAKLPERDAAEQQAKAAAQIAATREGVEVPLATMTLCLSGLEIAGEIAEHGNVNTVSDAGTGAEMLLAGLEGAAANVLINLAGLPEAEAPRFRAAVETARVRGQVVLAEVRRIVGAKLLG